MGLQSGLAPPVNRAPDPWSASPRSRIAKQQERQWGKEKRVRVPLPS